MKLYVWQYVIQESISGIDNFFVLMALASNLEQARILLRSKLDEQANEIEPRTFQEMVETIVIAHDISVYDVPVGIIFEV